MAETTRHAYISVMDEATLRARLDSAAASCAVKGETLTPLRRAVLALVLQADGPLTAYQLLDRLKQTHEKAMPPTIYRALDFLRAHELVHKIERLSAFIPCADQHGHAHGHAHPHAAQFLICRRCGAVAELEEEAVTQALAAAAAHRGFAPGNAVVEVEGLCGECAGQ